MTTLSARSERSLIVASRENHRHILATLVAPPLEGERQRSPMNLAFVLDRSGSMGHGKMELAKGATLEALTRLARGDYFAVVSYDDTVNVDLPSSLATRDTLETARARVGAIEARGSTDLCAGWLTGCREIAQHLDPAQVARCLLFTDGQANHGETNPAALAAHAAALRARGISTSTFGIGLGFDEVLLRSIAEEGGGNARYIESEADFRRLVDAELRDTLDVVLRGVILRASAPAGVRVELVGTWASTRKDGHTDIALGDLVSEEELSVVLRVTLPPGAEGETVGVELSLWDAKGELDAPPATVTWTRTGDKANRTQPRDLAIDRVVAERHAARALAAAVQANRAGDYRMAEAALHAVADRIAGYAGEDEVLRALVDKLRQDAIMNGRPMDERSSKRQFHRSHSSLRSKDVDGTSQRARRHPREEV